ncbi:c-type cytochrome [Bradyrhizobium sp. 137]|uniref:c-type cytochrome n=1 Tax=Bradyrhizobium sp. 137 TaxID=2782614 RepID=UPI001FFAE2FA|nr:c-type cytochrome [Bradyrhizobium sp. 137]
MNRFEGALKIAITFLASATVCVALSILTATAGDSPPRWAYPENNPNYKPPVDDGNVVRVPNSTAGYTWSQLRDRFVAPIWHPGDHRPLPDIVANGRKPDVLACGFCHRADGPGGPENADLAGLPKSYIIRQMADYKNGVRSTAVAGRLPTSLMIALSKPITDAEVEAAADYFSGLQPRKRIKVVESDTAPKSYIAAFLWAAVEGGEREPLGQRILEIPDDLHRFESRDPRSTFTAYVPVGSLAKGEALVKGGSGKTVACAPCHGPELKGLGPLPSIAGRSPSYMFRQLYDFGHGARSGELSPLMAQVVNNLDQDDMLAIVAYLASLDP